MAELALAWRSCPMISFPALRRYRASGAMLFRYSLVGIASNAAGYLVYLLFTSLGTTPKLTMTCLYGVGAAIGYIGNRKVTFSHKGSALASGARYMIAHLFGYLLNLVILLVFADRLGFPHQLVQAISVLVVAGFLFVIFKRFVFREANQSQPQQS